MRLNSKNLCEAAYRKLSTSCWRPRRINFTQAARYERSKQRQGYRSGHYSRNLTTTSGDVTLKPPSLSGTVVVKAVWKKLYIWQESVRRVEDITEALWGSNGDLQ